MIGCFFAIAGHMSQTLGYESWLQVWELEDASIDRKYLASLYWAAVTVSTVGYGDIVPSNNIEMFICLFLLFSGVALYSYIVSTLSNLFSSVHQGDETIQSRVLVITAFAQKQKFSRHLTKKIQYFFKSSIYH
jgi:hypothetical protein